MATPGRAPLPVAESLPPSRGSRSSRVYKIPFTAKTTPRWVAHLLGLITVLSAGYNTLSGPINQIVTTYSIGKESGADANEAYKHYSETPAKVAVTEDAAGKLEARLYASDGCVAVIWHGAFDRADSHPHFIRNLTNPNHQESPGKIASDKPLTAPANLAASLPFAGSHLLFGAHLAATAAPVGRCLDPHPGTFRSWYGETRGCWIQVWREFQDGCKHYQWFNKCGGFWDANPNGTPRVYWTDCRH